MSEFEYLEKIVNAKNAEASSVTGGDDEINV